MSKTSSIAIAAALALFGAQVALAQEQNSTKTGQEVQPPAATAPGTGTGTAQTTPATPSAGSASATSGMSTSARFLQTQTTEQFLGSDLMGARVRSAANEDIGEVNDVLFDMSGKGAAVLIGVGGFLGIGEKSVAVPFERLRVTREEGDMDNLQVSLETTKEELNAAPAFEERTAGTAATSSTEDVTPAPNQTGSTTGTATGTGAGGTMNNNQ
jgi:hypothetical protein